MHALSRPDVRLAALALCVALSGCSLFDSGPEALDFETLVQSNTFVQTKGDLFIDGLGIGPLVVLRSAADQARFRERFGAGPFPTAVDYARESVVGMVFESPVANSRGTIEAVSVDGDTFDFSIHVDGDIVVNDDETAVVYPAHFVRVRRLKDKVSGFTASYTGIE